MEARERQLEELHTLYSIFDSDLKVLDEGLTKFLVDGDAGFVDDSQRIDFDIRLELQVDTSDADVSDAGELELSFAGTFITLHCELPLRYPKEPARCTVKECLSAAFKMPSAALDALNRAMHERCLQAVKDEEDGAVYGFAMHAKQTAETILAEEVHQSRRRMAEMEYTTSSKDVTNLMKDLMKDPTEEESDWARANADRTHANADRARAHAERANSSKAAAEIVVLSRKFFWTHHTRLKQKLLYDWAKELRISGRVSVSRPGYTYVEGGPEDIEEFTRRNMGEKWKMIKITYEEDVRASSTSANSGNGQSSGSGQSSRIGTDNVCSSGAGRDEAIVRLGDELRLFGDGWRECTMEQFLEDFRATGRDDILEIGSKGTIKARQ